MIFLIHYDPKHQELLDFRSFDDAQRKEAERIRLQIELDLPRQLGRHEIILLHAADEATVRRSHRRYFESLQEIVEKPGCE